MRSFRSPSKSMWIAVGLALVSSCMWRTIGPDGFRQLLTPIVKKQAAFDLQCSEEQIQVTHIGDVSFGASGCGQRVSYVPESRSCYPDQFESTAKKVCTAVVANVATR